MSNLIGIIGCMDSGKDTVGKIIRKYSTHRYYEIKKFADKLKDIVCLLIGCTREDLEDREFKEKELGEEWWYYKLPNNSLISYLDENQPDFIKKYTLIKLTPRKLLQLLGTECGRNIIHTNIWINALFADYKFIERTKEYPNWIITDVRFPNEVEAIRNRGGVLIKLTRNMNTDSLHESEIHIPALYSDFTIDNEDISLEELEEKVKSLNLT